ncbi:hypothetical protein EV714DRAFT_199531 [Schizophyllum commune]
MEKTADLNNASNQAVLLDASEARLLSILRRRPAAYAFVQVNGNEDRRADAQLSIPVLAKVDSFAQVALAGIPESVVADATQKPTDPDPSYDGSQNAPGAADISCVLAPEHQNRHEDAGTNRKECLMTHGAPSTTPGETSADLLVQQRAPLPIITTFGVATNIAFEYPEIAKDVLALTIGSDAEALLGHKIKPRLLADRPEAQPTVEVIQTEQSTPSQPQPLSRATALHDAPYASRASPAKLQPDGSSVALSAMSSSPSPRLSALHDRGPSVSQQQGAAVQRQVSQAQGVDSDWRSRTRHQQHTTSQRHHVPPASQNAQHTSRNHGHPRQTKYSASSPSPSSTVGGGPSHTGSSLPPSPCIPSSDSEVWRAMLDECRARNAAGIADEVDGTSPPSSGPPKVDPMRRRRPSVPLPQPSSPGDEASKWNVYTDYRLPQSSTGLSPTNGTPPPGQSPADVWSPLQANARPTPPREQRVIDSPQYYPSDVDDIRLAYDVHPEYQYAPSDNAFYDDQSHNQHSQPAQTQQYHRQAPHQHQQYAYAQRGGPTRLSEELLESVSSMRVRTPSQKDVAALAYAHAAKVLRAQGLYSTASPDGPHPSAPRNAQPQQVFQAHPSDHGNMYSTANYRPLPRQPQPSVNDQYYSQRPIELANGPPIDLAHGPPFSSNVNLGDAYGGPPHPPLPDRRSADLHHRGPQQMTQEDVKAILTRRLMEVAEDGGYVQYAGAPQQGYRADDRGGMQQRW